MFMYANRNVEAVRAWSKPRSLRYFEGLVPSHCQVVECFEGSQADILSPL